MEKFGKEMARYRYITHIKDKLHVVENLWLAENYQHFKRPSFTVCEESENGIKIKGLTLKPIGQSYQEYLSGT